MSTEKNALVVVDVQNDFVTGPMAVKNATTIIANINLLLGGTKEGFFKYVFFSKDWHPKNHVSFKTNDGQWPEHCIRFTRGAQFHPDLKKAKNFVIYKGVHQNYESYSIFKDERNHSNETLINSLKSNNITNIYICGFAYEYCVLNTALDSTFFGFNTFILSDCIGFVDSEKSTRSTTILTKKNVKFITMDELPRKASL